MSGVGPARFRKRPVVVEAMRMGDTTAAAAELTAWINSRGYPWLIGDALDPSSLRAPDSDEVPTAGIWIDPADGLLMIRTLEGDMRVAIGAWVLLGVAGEMYPCDAAIFDATYDPAD